MKLRNKKTGEIKDWDTLSIEIIKNGEYFDGESYNSLVELNEEWEDYEEPKEYWYIDSITGKVHETEDTDCSFDDRLKETGNYFETREEAEKAVEKLKAWKRLKNKGFKFTGWNCAMKKLYFDVPDDFFPNKSYYASRITEETEKDLNLLFGGEE